MKRQQSQNTAQPRTSGQVSLPGVAVRPGSGQGNAAAQEDLPSRLHRAAARANAAVPHRERMERSFGADLGDVRVALGGEEAESLLGERNANAVAIGDRILFADPDPDPELVGHELTHVIQQRGAGPGGGEAEAEAAGEAVAAGRAVDVKGGAPRGQPQFDLRNTISSNRQKRDVDAPVQGDPLTYAQFIDADDQAPDIHHDHGFLDDGSGGIDESKRRDASAGDYLTLAEYTTMLEGAEVLRPDLVDGTSAYRHFLEGNGQTRSIDYDRFIGGDSSGAAIEVSLLEDTQQAVVARHDQMLAGRTNVAPGRESFRMRTEPIPVTSGDTRYPYPATENWQKAIGAHTLWVEAAVTVELVSPDQTNPLDRGAPLPGGVADPAQDAGISVDGGVPAAGVIAGAPAPLIRVFTVRLTVHMEDRYNFNPGMADMVTGAADADNGALEECGLGHEYMNIATFNRELSFQTSMDSAAPVPGSSSTTGAPRTTDRPAGRRPYATTR